MQINQNHIANINTKHTSLTGNSIDPEQIIGLDILKGYDEELFEITGKLQQAVDTKKVLREDLAKLSEIKNSPTIEHDGKNYQQLTDAQSKWVKKNYPDSSLETIDNDTLVLSSTIDSLKTDKEYELAGINEQNEYTTLKVQNLMEQRKLSFTMITQVQSSYYETAKRIIDSINR